ncbi:MAG: ATP-binding protein [Defluviitaleaceae bacterium]|nr:ATP-binding protein [Defluviitaleaceae bacterium]
MKYAEGIKDFINAFNAFPLREEDLEEFYDDGTIEHRFGNKYVSDIQDIFEDCQEPSENNTFLLLGHKGCGKSTELNKMAKELKELGYPAHIVQCKTDLDLLNAQYTDLLILMGGAVLSLAEEIGCQLPKELSEKISLFWNTQTESEKVVTKGEEVSAEVGVGTGSLFNLVFARVKAGIKHSGETRNIYRTKINHRASDWLSLIEEVANEVTKKSDGKQPIIIFEELDTLNAKDAEDIFTNYTSILRGLSFPIIYTYPIASYYNPRFGALYEYYNIKILPMIRISNLDGTPYIQGINSIKSIVEKRCDLALFDGNTLDELIIKTGGSLRGLFNAINTAAKISIRKGIKTITGDETKIALSDKKNSLTSIENKYHEFLAEIQAGNHTQITDKEMLLEMMNAGVVIEYKNGPPDYDRWHDVHPLISEFLTAQGLSKK